jgi:hypothetical protein
MPNARASADLGGPVAGTMQSTMAFGKVQCASIQSASAGSTGARATHHRRAVMAPLPCRLSQLCTVKGPMPASRRRPQRGDHGAEGGARGGRGWRRHGRCRDARVEGARGGVGNSRPRSRSATRCGWRVGHLRDQRAVVRLDGQEVDHRAADLGAVPAGRARSAWSGSPAPAASRAWRRRRGRTPAPMMAQSCASPCCISRCRYQA